MFRFINPVKLLHELEDALDEDSIIVADGGDFVGTAAYILRLVSVCLLYTSPSPRDKRQSRMPSSA